jgi:hexokinase
LILIGACYSQPIAKVIKEKVKNAIVIAINKETPVLDQAATSFAKCLYDKLLKGFTPIKSFEYAQ